MKQVLRILLIILTFSSSNSLSAQVQGKFGNTQSALDVNAALEVESTSKGVLLPRLTTAQQNAMSAPTNGMLIYNTDSACFVLRRAGVWRSLCAANGGEAWSTLGNTGTNVNTHFLGTTDNTPLSIRVNNQRTLTFGTDTSFYRGNSGNTRGTNAVDLQSARSAATQVASGRFSVLGGGEQNTASGDYTTIGGGKANTTSGTYNFIGGGNANAASGALSTLGGGYLNSVSNDYATVSGGHTNSASGDYATIGGGSANVASGSNANVGGGTSNVASALRSTVGGGFANTVSTTYSNINGGSTNSITSSGSINTIGGGFGNSISGNTTYSIIGGGNNNAVSTADRATIAGGQSNATTGNASFIGGGYRNIVSGSYTTLVGGADNTVSNGYAALVGGSNNTASGNGSFIGGGSANTASGTNTAIIGGSGLTLSGNNSFGFNGLGAPSVSAANTAYFGNVNLWLGNVGGASTELRFYEPNASLTYTGTNYTAFKAGVQLSDITYTLPLADGSSNQVLTTNGTGALSWSNGSAFAWNLLGNASTVDGTNFIGTTDNVPLSIRVNNQRSGYIGLTTSSNTYFGYQAGLVTTGTENTFIGGVAGSSNTTGDENTAVGNRSLQSNTTGDDNTAVGEESLKLNTTGISNTGLGESAMENNTTGSYNTGVGAEALFRNSDGDDNTAVGESAMESNNIGSSNTALGRNVLFNNTAASRNVSIGNEAMFTQSFNNSGSEWNSDNIGIGYQSLYFNQPTSTTNGYRNIAIGTDALRVNTTGATNIAIGYQAGNTNTTGSNNTLLGYDADVSSATLTNATAIGANTVVGASNSLVLGNLVNVGINTTTPQYKLDINAQTGSSGNPLRLLGLNAGASTDSVLTAASGVVRRRSVAEVLANAWNITGNTGTTAGTNFIGTTDAQGLAFRTNNTEWMRLNTTGSLGIGLTSPVYKVHVEEPGGFNADIAARLYNTNNLAYQPSLLLQTSGGTKAAPTAVANTTTLGVIRWSGYDGSTFNDVQATEIGAKATEAWSTTAHGSSLGFKTIPNTTLTALTRMTIDQNGNVGIGTTTPAQQLEITAAMRMPATTTSTTGVIYKGANRFIHDYKPAANNGNNTFMGVNAGNFTMTSATSWLASGNTGVGTNALTALTDAGYNTAMGFNALTATTTGSYNTALGASALAANTTGTGNTAIGNGALQLNTTANGGVAIGNGALSKNTTGAANTSIGESSLLNNTTGYFNTSIGQSSMLNNVSGYQNTAVGLSAMQSNTSGIDNIAIGVSALYANTTTNGSIAIGNSALSSTTSSGNIAIGQSSGTGTTTGGNNTFVGYQTGLTNTTGANNTLLGYQANVSAGTYTNATAIGNGATVNASNKIRLGNTSITNVETYGSFTTISDRRLKNNITDNAIGLNFIKAVRPVQYELTTQKGIVYDGFVAQEIDSILLKQGITNFSGLVRPLETQNSKLETQNTEGSYYTVSYATFVVPLVNAVKELDALSEQLKVKSEKCEAENAVLKAELEKMKQDNATLKASVDKNSQDIEAIKAALTKKQN